MSRLRMNQGISINTWAREWEPLKEAADRGDLEKVKELAQKFEATDQPVQIALAIASRGNHLDVVRYILERGTSVGPDALRLARTIEAFEMLIELGGWKINDPYRWTPTTMIVPIIELDDIKLLQWFLDNGADPNFSDSLGDNPACHCLPTAAEHASPPVVDLLLAHGAKHSPYTLHAVISNRDRDPREKIDMLHHLVYNRGCDINEVSPLLSKYPRPKEGTPLHSAAHAGCFDSIRWLVENGADVLKGGSEGLLPSSICSTEDGVLRLVISVEESERNYREAKARERTGERT